MRGQVLLVTGEYPPLRGGVGAYTQRLGAALGELGWSVAVATRPLPHRADEFPPVRDEVPGWDIGSLVRWTRRVRQREPASLLHLHYQAGAFALRGAPLLLPLLARPLPVVTTFHDLRVPYLFPKAGPVRQLALRLLARTSAAVVVTNPEDERVVRRWGVASARLWRIPIGSNLPAPRDPQAARQRLGVSPAQPFVAFFGFRQPEKGLETLLAALASLPEPRPLVVLVGGERPDTDETRVVPAASLAAARALPVLDLGYRPAPEVADLLAAADLVVLPFRQGASLRNGTLIGALACGAAVLTTAPPDPAQLLPLRDGEHLQFVPPGDPVALAAALAGLLTDAARRERLRAGARAIAPVFAWERIAARHDQLYQLVLARAAARR